MTPSRDVAAGSVVFLSAPDLHFSGRSLVWVDRNGERKRVDVPPGHKIKTPRVNRWLDETLGPVGP